MITQHISRSGQCLILSPNRSADWQTNRRLLIVVTLLSAVIAGAFAAIGAWVILPFAGLEMLALGTALYWVNWHQYYRQVLWFEGSELRIEKGYYHPRDRWDWQLGNTSIHVNEPSDADRPLAIYLAQGGQRIPIGEFLNANDCQTLLRSLKAQGLAIRSFSLDGDLAA